MKIKPLMQSSPLLFLPVEAAAPALPLHTAAEASSEEQLAHLQTAHPEPPSSWPPGPHGHQQGLLEAQAPETHGKHFPFRDGTL